MSRFENLELDGPGGPERGPAPGEPVRDCRHFYERGQEAWRAGDFEAALRNCSRAVEQNRAFFEGWLGQVRMLIELAEYPEALLWTDRALELFPRHPELLAAKAVAYARDEKPGQALAWSDNALAQDRATAYVWLARAEVLLQRQHHAAQDCLSNALSLAGTGLPVVRLEAGRLLSGLGRSAEALEYLQAAIRDLPKSALAWYELGRCQAALGLPEAETALQQSTQLRPGWPQAQHALGRFQRRGLTGRLRDAFRRLFRR